MALSTRNGISQNRAKGLGYRFPFVPISVAGSAPTATSGFIALNVQFNTVGATLPGTLQTLPLPSALSSELFATFKQWVGSSQRSSYLAFLYKMGTVDLANAAATPYDGFTHNANWSGTIQRPSLGQTGQNIQLLPLIYVTVATATTAPAFILQTTSGPGNGYKNQANVGVTGTKTFTMPLAATIVQSAFILRLEDGDSAITDITQVSVTTKGTAGTATIFGVELLLGAGAPLVYGGIGDAVVGGLSLSDMTPGTPTTGTLTVNTDVFLAALAFGSQAAPNPVEFFSASLNT